MALIRRHNSRKLCRSRPKDQLHAGRQLARSGSAENRRTIARRNLRTAARPALASLPTPGAGCYRDRWRSKMAVRATTRTTRGAAAGTRGARSSSASPAKKASKKVAAKPIVRSAAAKKVQGKMAPKPVSSKAGKPAAKRPALGKAKTPPLSKRAKATRRVPLGQRATADTRRAIDGILQDIRNRGAELTAGINALLDRSG